MKQKLAVALLLLSAFSVFGQAIQRNYYTTNVNPALPSGATNGIFTLNGFGTNTTLRNLNVVSVAAEWPSNSATATLATNSISTRFPTNVVFRVSSRSIAGGTATIANNGANFGPDTAGTTTSGIQEAINAATYVADAGPTVGGVTVELVDHAYYYFTNMIVVSNYFPRAFTFKGQNLLSTKMVYAGPTNVVQTILFMGAGTPRALSLNIPVHLTISDMGFSSITNSTNILLRVTDYSDLNISRANFTSWQMMTNQVEGAGVSTDSNSTDGITQGDQVGLVLDSIDAGGDHGTSLNDLYFAGLATAIYTESDHISAKNLRFAHIGLFTNHWPATSKYSLGAGILRAAGLDSKWEYLHFYSMNAGFVLLGEGVDTPLLDHANFESCQWPVASVSTNSRAPLLRDPCSGFGNGPWVTETFYSLQVSNSPNYGFIGVAHPAAVTYGSDGFGVADGSKYWQLDIKGGSRMYFDYDGTDVGTRMVGIASVVAASGYNIDLNPNTGLTITDNGFVDFVTLEPDGDMSWTGVGSGLLDTTIATNTATDDYVLSATGNRLKWVAQSGGPGGAFTGNANQFSVSGGVTNIKSGVLLTNIVVEESEIFSLAGTPKVSFDLQGDTFRFNDLFNTIDGVWIYDFNTGVIGMASLSAETFVGNTMSGNGSGISNAVDLIAGLNISIQTNANNRSFTISSTGGGGNVTLTNTTQAAGVITGSSPSTIFGIGTNLAAAATNTFYVQENSSTWTNRAGGEYAIDTFNSLKLGTNTGGTLLAENVSRFGNGIYLDDLTTDDTYFVGQAHGGVSAGDFNLNNGNLNQVDVATDVDVAGDVTLTGNFLVVTNVMTSTALIDYNYKYMFLSTNNNLSITGITNQSSAHFNESLLAITNNSAATKTVTMAATFNNMNPSEGLTLYCTNYGELLVTWTRNTGTNFYWKSR